MITSQYSGKTEQQILSNLVAGELKVASEARRTKTLNNPIETGFVSLCDERSLRDSH